MKKSEFKEYIKNEILNELAVEEATIETSPEDLSKVKSQADKDDTIKVVEEENIGLADLEEMGYEAGEKAFDMHFDKSILNNTPDTKSYKKGFVQAIIDSAGSLRLDENIGLADLEERGYEAGGKAAYTYGTSVIRLQNRPNKLAYNKGFMQGVKDELGSSLFEGENLNEMAKIAGDLKSSIEKVMSDNPDIETKELKKLIQSNSDVKSALGDAKLYDTQLAKFISASKGEREIGQRGRKVNPNTVKRPKSPTGSVGRPRKTQDKKDKESKTVSSKLNKSITTAKGEEPSAKDIKQAVGFTRKGKKDLQVQEKRKMVKAFIADMKKEGIISTNGKVEDKEKYDAAWATSKSEIEAAVKNIK